jgi:hypothetical protein
MLLTTQCELSIVPLKVSTYKRNRNPKNPSPANSLGDVAANNRAYFLAYFVYIEFNGDIIPNVGPYKVSTHHTSILI